MKININHLHKVEDLPSKTSTRYIKGTCYWNMRMDYRNPQYYKQAACIIKGSIGRSKSTIVKKVAVVWPVNNYRSALTHVESWVDFQIMPDRTVISTSGMRPWSIDINEDHPYDIYYFDLADKLRLKRGKRRRQCNALSDRDWYNKQSEKRKSKRELKHQSNHHWSLLVYLVNKPEYYIEYTKLKRKEAALHLKYIRYVRENEEAARKAKPNQNTMEDSWRRLYKRWEIEARIEWENARSHMQSILDGDHTILDKLVREEQIRKAREAERVARMKEEQALKQAA